MTFDNWDWVKTVKTELNWPITDRKKKFIKILVKSKDVKIPSVRFFQTVKKFLVKSKDVKWLDFNHLGAKVQTFITIFILRYVTFFLFLKLYETRIF